MPGPSAKYQLLFLVLLNSRVSRSGRVGRPKRLAEYVSLLNNCLAGFECLYILRRLSLAEQQG